MGNLKRTPEIRFPEFKKEWEQKPLKHYLAESKKLNGDLKYDKSQVLSVSGELGCVNQIEHLGRSYAGESVHNYGVVETGDIVYTKSPLKANPYGIIRLNKGKAGIVSTLYAVYKVKEKNATGEFLDYYFSLDANTNRYLRPLVKKGAKNDMKINNAYVLHDKIFAPSIPEQKRIATFLSKVDIRLAQLKEKKALLEEYKKGMMQKIFSQDLRLRDDNGNEFPEWETRPLNKIFKLSTKKNGNNSFNEVLTNSATKGIVCQDNYFEREVANQNNLRGYYIVEINDFVYNPRISHSAPVGPLKRNKLHKGVISPLYIVLNCTYGDLGFYEYYFETNMWHPYMKSIANYGVRFDRMNITKRGFEKMPLPVPSIEEQQLISRFIFCIDVKVNACRSEIEQTQEYKKSLLQQMFCV